MKGEYAHQQIFVSQCRQSNSLGHERVCKWHDTGNVLTVSLDPDNNMISNRSLLKSPPTGFSIPVKIVVLRHARGFECHHGLWTYLQVCGSKRFSCHADHYTVSRCHTRGKSEKSNCTHAFLGGFLFFILYVFL